MLTFQIENGKLPFTVVLAQHAGDEQKRRARVELRKLSVRPTQLPHVALELQLNRVAERPNLKSS